MKKIYIKLEEITRREGVVMVPDDLNLHHEHVEAFLGEEWETLDFSDLPITGRRVVARDHFQLYSFTLGELGEVTWTNTGDNSVALAKKGYFASVGPEERGGFGFKIVVGDDPGATVGYGFSHSFDAARLMAEGALQGLPVHEIATEDGEEN
ncbi:hypothetical protein GS982_01540 [Rhodococcus hoagii]|uniref:DUF3846 domain-containing protein n=1 Tax=Rhodococcus hoagii TaxID=43767 RepID=A0A9Q5EW59_RHOHA|nr:hypothetical protein [Prescottella equi]NKT77280.1 hypothetical protein [Prescottella equi]NKT78004.1 hypothetical protein [Prescottella equi]NKZ81067.1 hypothetical protein [Prescottella equi]